MKKDPNLNHCLIITRLVASVEKAESMIQIFQNGQYESPFAYLVNGVCKVVMIEVKLLLILSGIQRNNGG